jgi:hypothetical protein
MVKITRHVSTLLSLNLVSRGATTNVSQSNATQETSIPMMEASNYVDNLTTYFNSTSPQIPSIAEAASGGIMAPNDGSSLYENIAKWIKSTSHPHEAKCIKISFIYDDSSEGHTIEGYAWQANIHGKRCDHDPSIHDAVLEAVGKFAKQMRKTGYHTGCKRFSHDSPRTGSISRLLHGPQWRGYLRLSRMPETQPVKDVECEF